ncbi:hypothetical protein GOODEAATRI_018956 [Goodea atripinnis]|uniref:Uncharacterized protein n=1 Tax=Goodea atripinnis TaxID=208336 RepID=A0ABV0NMF2_9TELE
MKTPVRFFPKMTDMKKVVWCKIGLYNRTVLQAALVCTITKRCSQEEEKNKTKITKLNQPEQIKSLQLDDPLVTKFSSNLTNIQRKQGREVTKKQKQISTPSLASLTD